MMFDVEVWVTELGLGQYAAAFRANDIDADVLRWLSSDDLKELGVSSLEAGEGSARPAGVIGHAAPPVIAWFRPVQATSVSGRKVMLAPGDSGPAAGGNA